MSRLFHHHAYSTAADRELYHTYDTRYDAIATLMFSVTVRSTLYTPLLTTRYVACCFGKLRQAADRYSQEILDHRDR